MNASQRRQTARARTRTLSSVIAPGAPVRRLSKGKAAPTTASVQSVTPRGVNVVRADKRTVFWPFAELVEQVSFRNHGKGHALRLSARLG